MKLWCNNCNAELSAPGRCSVCGGVEFRVTDVTEEVVKDPWKAGRTGRTKGDGKEMLLDATNVEKETDLEEQQDQDQGEAEAMPADTGPQDLEDQFDQALAEGDAQDQGQAEAPAEEQPSTEGLGPINEITLDIAKRSKTTVVLLVQFGPDGRWRSGFRTTRNYTLKNGTEPNAEELPNPEIEMDEGKATLGEAVIDAAEWAKSWLSNSAGDGDKHAEYAVASVIDFIEAASPEMSQITETIFDNQPTEAEANGEPDPATNDTPAEAVVEQPAEKKYGATEESKGHFEARKQELAWAIAQFHIKLAESKANVKRLSKAIDSAVEELDELIGRGPEVLPLFDQHPKAAEREQAEVTGDDPDTTTDAEATNNSDQDPAVTGVAPEDQQAIEADSAEADTEWRSVKLSDLDGLTPKILEILESRNIRTMGDFADFPKINGIEYTQIDGMTERRFERVQEAMDRYWKDHPQPVDWS